MYLVDYAPGLCSVIMGTCWGRDVLYWKMGSSVYVWMKFTGSDTFMCNFSDGAP